MQTLSAKEIASRLNTDPRTLRKFLRADARANDAADSLPGKGSRYAIPASQVKSLHKRFTAWEMNRTPKTETDAPDAE